jgi:hypothetical protein
MPKKLIRFLLLAGLLSRLLCMGALALSIEQTQVKMPGIDVYLYQDGNELSELSPSEVTAALDGVPLAVRGLGRSEQGIFYVYMLDVSASIPAPHFYAARDAVAAAYERLRPQDRMALLTFGSEVTPLLRGDESREEVMAALESLQNRDSSTKFYNAMDALVDLVSQTSEMRRVAVVISDGIDDTDAGMTQEELETKLRQTGVSVSAMCLDSAPEAVVHKLRDFIHISGGELYLFGAGDASDVLANLLGRLEGGWLLRLEAPNNLAKGNVAELSITLSGGEAVSSDVKLDDWVPDNTRPRVTGAVYDGASNTLLVSFSEPVTGADSLTSYALTGADGTALPIDRAELLEDGSCRLHIAPGALPETGDVTLTVSGLRDVSMEENELYRYSEVVIAGAQAQESAPSAAPAAETLRDEPLLDVRTLVFFGAAGLLLAAGAAALIVRSVRGNAGKKRRPEKEDKKKPREKEEKPTATFMFDRKP